MHLGGAPDPDDLAHRRRVERGRPGDQRHLRAAPRGFRRNRVAHAAARSVADVAHRVDVLVGRAGGDEDALPAQRPFGPEDRLGRGDDLVGLGEPALADPAAREVALARLDEPHAARGERVEVPAHRLVLEHLRVHRRRDQHRRARRRVQRRQEIVGDPVGELADEVGGGRGDEQQIDRRRERDVLDVGVHPRLELIGDDAAARDRLERDRADKARRRVRHHGDDLVAALLQPARDLDGLVGADAAGDAERDQSHNRLPDYPITRLPDPLSARPRSSRPPS